MTHDANQAVVLVNHEIGELPPPSEAAVTRAVADFANAVRRFYGERLKGIYLFGSRARGDHRPDSDADLAVVLDEGKDWVSWQERRRLIALASEINLSRDVLIQPWPLSHSEWSRPATGAEHFLGNVRREGVLVAVDNPA